MIEVDVYLGTISRFWIMYTNILEKGESVQDKEKAFLTKLENLIPIERLICTDNPLKLNFDNETSGLIAVTHISDIEDLYFPPKVGEYTLLSFEHIQGAYTGLYVK